MPVSLERLQKKSLHLALPSPHRSAMGKLTNQFTSGAGQVDRPGGSIDYLTAFFLGEAFSGRGLRTWAFTMVSSTGVVPVTSFANVAPEGTR